MQALVITTICTSMLAVIILSHLIITFLRWRKEPLMKDVPMSVEDRILEGHCDGCDQDPTECLYRDYCIYEEAYNGENVQST